MVEVHEGAIDDLIVRKVDSGVTELSQSHISGNGAPPGPRIIRNGRNIESGAAREICRDAPNAVDRHVAAVDCVAGVVRPSHDNGIPIGGHKVISSAVSKLRQIERCVGGCTCPSQ
jgi:hypothetical protein